MGVTATIVPVAGRPGTDPWIDVAEDPEAESTGCRKGMSADVCAPAVAAVATNVVAASAKNAANDLVQARGSVA